MTEEKKIRKLITGVLKQSSNPTPLVDLRKAIISDDLLTTSYGTKSERKSAFAHSLDELLEKKKVKLRGDGVILVDKERSDNANDDNKKRRRNDDEYEDDERDTIGRANKLVQEDTGASDDGNGNSNSETTGKYYPPAIVNEADCVNSILLFYAYCIPQMSRAEQDNAIAHCYGVLKTNGCSGRLRVAREGFNATLTGPSEGIRAFTAALRATYPQTFGNTDFKYVDNQPSNQLLKGLKVWPVTEIVTYGFDPKDAPLDFHAALTNPNSVVIDVRNFNETLIGKFAPPTVDGVAPEEKVLDPCMRKSTEFPQWVDDNKYKLEGKQVLMYCTAGVRCERASAFMRNRGVENVFQLEGGIHRYLDAYPDDGGYWVGKNYTFDKRFSHGASTAETISHCVLCKKPWDRYQSQKTCFGCKMEVLLCKDCQKAKPKKEQLKCPLCK